MVATLWLISLLTTTLITASECVYATPLVKYRLLPDTSLGFQDNFLTAKRTKPSLSIVNPLDVLRQRLLLEIARRQMRENTKQVELNRAYLKNVGKRNKEIPTEPYESYEQRRIDAALTALTTNTGRSPTLAQQQHTFDYLDDADDDDPFLDTRYSNRFLLHPLPNPANENTDHDNQLTETKEKPVRHAFYLDHQQQLHPKQHRQQQQQLHRQQQQLHRIQHEPDANEKSEQSHKQRARQRQQHKIHDFDADLLLQQLNWN